MPGRIGNGVPQLRLRLMQANGMMHTAAGLPSALYSVVPQYDFEALKRMSSGSRYDSMPMCGMPGPMSLPFCTSAPQLVLWLIAR
ncbi:hypothetical protein [Nannocystis exedens]|uniref:hypothetical protein n=1 Tax=Nannocystis exedens TaxID=54 RepID=UPI000BC42EB4|nr:hypothetical protein [Nannocystis exedens]PCC74289.1 hypothetical protein NAEX_07378 [Nannocystis exedens]